MNFYKEFVMFCICGGVEYLLIWELRIYRIYLMGIHLLCVS
jgi:hypothetical protein